jgi:chromate transporter
VRGFGLAFDMPVLASVNPWAFLLSLAAIVAIFRFKAGTIQTSPTPRPPGSSFT